jgi:hypothetical protein
LTKKKEKIGKKREEKNKEGNFHRQTPVNNNNAA